MHSVYKGDITMNIIFVGRHILCVFIVSFTFIVGVRGMEPETIDGVPMFPDESSVGAGEVLSESDGDAFEVEQSVLEELEEKLKALPLNFTLLSRKVGAIVEHIKASGADIAVRRDVYVELLRMNKRFIKSIQSASDDFSELKYLCNEIVDANQAIIKLRDFDDVFLQLDSLFGSEDEAAIGSLPGSDNAPLFKMALQLLLSRLVQNIRQCIACYAPSPSDKHAYSPKKQAHSSL